MSKKLNLGCGGDIKPDYINVDRIKLPGVDIVHDLNRSPWPFKNNEFDEILCKHVIEHLDDIEKVMKELLRILKPTGKIIIISPHFTSANAYGDITHKHFFGYKAFDKYNVIKKKIIFGKRFAIWNYLIEPIANLFPNFYESTPFRIFPALELYVELTK